MSDPSGEKSEILSTIVAIIGALIIAIIADSIIFPDVNIFQFLKHTFSLKGGLTVLVIITAVILSLLWLIARGERRNSGFYRFVKKYGGQQIIKWMRNNPNKFIRWLLTKWQRGDFLLEGELPPVFKDLKVELMTLMNYQTRLHTYGGKAGSVAQARDKAKKIEDYFGGKSKTFEGRRAALEKYRFGNKGYINKSYGWSNNKDLIDFFFNHLKNFLKKDLTVEIDHFDENIKNSLESTMNQRLGQYKKAYEQYQVNIKRFGLIHLLKSLRMQIIDLVALYGVYKHYYRFANEEALFELWEYKTDDVSDEDKSKGFVKPILSADPIKKNLAWEQERNNEYNRIKNGVMEIIKKRIIKKILINKQKFLISQISEKAEADYNPDSGLAKEEYIQSKINEARNSIWRELRRELREKKDYIKKEALFQFEFGIEENEEGVTDELLEGDIEVRAMMTGRAAVIKNMHRNYKLGWAISNKFRHEVDIKGFVLADLHEIEVDHKEPSHGLGKYIRRIKIEDIEDFPHPTENANWAWIYEQIYQEWNFFLDDLRWGKYHPFSRSIIDYTNIVTKGRSTNFENIKRTMPLKPSNPAFDHEALAYPGNWVYWGRRNYWDPEPEMKNPFPTISTAGLSQFLTAVVRMRENNSELGEHYLGYWVWDTSQDKIFTNFPGGDKEK